MCIYKCVYIERNATLKLFQNISHIYIYTDISKYKKKRNLYHTINNDVSRGETLGFN